MRNHCVDCGRVVDVAAPQWRWVSHPRCRGCGGPFDPAPAGRHPSAVDWLRSEVPCDAWDIACRDAGLSPGTAIEVATPNAPIRVFRLRGELEEVLQDTAA